MSCFYSIGRYRCIVTDQAFTQSRSQKPMIVFKVRPEALVEEVIGDDGELHQEETKTAQQYERTVRLVIVEDKPESLDYAMQKLRFAGFTGASFAELNLRGESVLCDCTHEPYNGAMSEQWNLALPARASKPLENDESIPRKLNAIFGRKLTEGATISPAPERPVMAGAGGGAGADVDEIPFNYCR